jgi:hypothetical protein
MGELDSRLEPEDKHRISDAAPLGRSKTTMSAVELTEYAGASYRAFVLLEARINARDHLGVGMLNTRIDPRLIVSLGSAAPLGRSPKLISKTEITDFAGALYVGYESLAARVGTLEGGPAGTEMEGRLEAGDKAKLVEAAPWGRSRSKMGNKELSEWSGATDAAYAALDARVAALESAT